MAHLAIGTGDLGEDAHHWADEMEESHGWFDLVLQQYFCGRQLVVQEEERRGVEFMYFLCSKPLH
jgi:hypothetical protein